MANLLGRLLRPTEISRFNLDSYIKWLAANTNAGLASPLYPPAVSYTQRGKPTERIENSFTGYTYGGYKANPIVFGVMKRRSSVFSEARFMWRELKDGQPGDLFWDDTLDLLSRPWPNGTTGELLTRMIQDVDLAGNFYCVAENDRLRRLRPDWVQIVLSGDPLTEPDVDVMGYVYTPGGPDNGKGVAYQVDEICHWSPIPDPDAQYRGMSWMTPVIREIQADQAAVEHKLAFFRNGATLGPIVKVSEKLSVDQFKEFMRASEEAHAGVNNAYKTMYLGGGADVTLAAADFRQLEFTGAQGKAETRICVAGGVPAVIAGVSEGLQGSSLNAGNYNAAKRSFIDGEMRTLWRSACGALSSVVEPPKDAELWWDEAGIAYLRDDMHDIATIQQTQFAAMAAGIQSGFEPKTIVDAIVSNDLTRLKHTGLTSVQLMPPGQGAPDQSGTDGGGQGAGDETPYGAPGPPDQSLVDEALRANAAHITSGAQGGQFAPKGYSGGGSGAFSGQYQSGPKGNPPKAPTSVPAKPSQGISKTLKRGESGPEVSQLQAALQVLGIASPHNGTFDAQTEQGVRQIQRKLGMLETGHVSPALMSKMQDAIKLSPCLQRSEEPDDEVIERAEDFDEDEDEDADADADDLGDDLLDALDSLWRSWTPEQEAMHPRGPGGKFRSVGARLAEALHDWLRGDGGEHLIDSNTGKPFTRPQLRGAAKGLGISLPRSTKTNPVTDEHIEELIKEHARQSFRDVQEATSAFEPHRFTLRGDHGFKGAQVTVYTNSKGQIILREEPTPGTKRRTVVTAKDMAGLEEWAKGHDEPQVAQWARGEIDKASTPAEKVAPRQAAASKSFAAEMDARLADAYDRLNVRGREQNMPHGDWVRITDLRREMGGTREEQDAALLRLAVATKGASVIPNEDQKTLTAQDRADALMISGRRHDLVRMGPAELAKLRSGAASTPAKTLAIPTYSPPSTLTPDEQARATRLVRADPQLYATVQDRLGNISTSGNLSHEDEAWLQSVFEREPAFVNHLVQTATIDRRLAEQAQKAGIPVGEFKRETAARLKEVVADKPIATRVPNEAALNAILSGGRFRTSHEGTKRGLGMVADPGRRTLGEEINGTPADTPVERRPIYGYVAISGIEPALSEGKKISGIAQREGQEDVLSSYGKIQVVLKPQVRDRTSITVGDSLDEIGFMRPSPIDNPTADSVGIRDVAKIGEPGWSRRGYVEAQIHGGVTTSDIAEVVFPSEPSAQTVAHLGKQGIPWRVLRPGDKPIAPGAGSDVEQAARDRQARIDKARGVADLLSEVDQLHHDEASPKVMEHRIRSGAKAGGVAPEVADELAKADVKRRVEDAYASLPKSPGGWVGLPALRATLGDLNRDDVDSALRELSREKGVRLAPFDNTKSLDREHIDAALKVGDSPRHMIAMGRNDEPLPGSLSTSLDRIAAEHNLHRTTGPAGSVEPFDPARHELAPGAPRPDRGAPVTVWRPGYEAHGVDAGPVQLSKATVHPASAQEVAAGPKPSAPPAFNPADPLAGLEGKTTVQKRAALSKLGLSKQEIDALVPLERKPRAKTAETPLNEQDVPESVVSKAPTARVDSLKPGDQIYGFAGRYGIQARRGTGHGLTKTAQVYTVVRFDPVRGELVVRDDIGQTDTLAGARGGELKGHHTVHVASYATRSADLDDNDIERAEVDPDPAEIQAWAEEDPDDFYDEPEAERAAGHDVTPGHDELHHYWTRGEGLAKWADSPKPWTTLVAHLTKYVGPLKAKIYASRWFIEVFGFAAGSDKNRVLHGHPPRGHRIGPG